MEYTEMIETLKEHEDNLPEGTTLEAVKQARETLPDLYEALKKAKVYLNPDSFGEASTLDLANKALAKAEGK